MSDSRERNNLRTGRSSPEIVHKHQPSSISQVKDPTVGALLSELRSLGECLRGILDVYIGNDEEKSRRDREAKNIQFAQGSSSDDLINILQYELLRARTDGTEVRLSSALVHDIKYRLSWYRDEVGEVIRKPRNNYKRA